MSKQHTPDDFFIDSEGYVVVGDPQHGHGSRIRKATDVDKQVYDARWRLKQRSGLEKKRSVFIGKDLHWGIDRADLS